MPEKVNKKSQVSLNVFANQWFCVSNAGSNSKADLKSGGLEKITLLDNQSDQVGAVLGTFINWSKSLVCEKSVKLKRRMSEYVDNSALLEQELYSYAGSWVAFIDIGTVSRVYLDCNASLGLVYHADKKLAASGVIALLGAEDYEALLDQDLIKHFGIQNNGWFPSGLTAHEGVKRLLPNHYLDLNTWRCERHWPKTIPASTAPAQACEVINKVVSNTLDSLVKKSKNKTSVALTAGHETRYLLAVSESNWNNLSFVSVDFPASKLDVFTAGKLADQHGLKHLILERLQSSSGYIDHFPYFVNHSVSGGEGAQYAKSLEPLKDFDYFIGGLGGEVGRAYIHKNSDSDNTDLDAQGILHRLGLPAIPAAVTATEQWLRGVNHLPATLKIDLAYIELRTGPWAFASSYVPYPCVQLHPLVNREIYTQLLGLPIEVRKRNFLKYLINHTNPDTLKLPINRYGDFRDQIAFIKKIKPAKIASKLRKVFA